MFYYMIFLNLGEKDDKPWNINNPSKYLKKGLRIIDDITYSENL